MSKNLLLRIISAAIYFPILLMSAYHTPSFIGIMAFLAFWAWYEYLGFRLGTQSLQEKLIKLGLAIFGSFPLWAGFLNLHIGHSLAIVAVGFQLVFVYRSIKGQSLEEIWSRLQFYVMGFLYITGLFGAICFLQQQPGGKEAVWFLLIIVGVTDSGAYFVGKAIGTHLLFPKYSPKKTREGLWGGLFFALVASIAFVFFFKQLHFSVPEIWVAALIGLMLSLASTFGDLFESKLKRQYQVKDSGGLIPGHGGVLDRFDGVLFAAAPLLLVVLFLGGF